MRKKIKRRKIFVETKTKWHICICIYTQMLTLSLNIDAESKKEKNEKKTRKNNRISPWIHLRMQHKRILYYVFINRVIWKSFVELVFSLPFSLHVRVLTMPQADSFEPVLYTRSHTHTLTITHLKSLSNVHILYRI